jgi:hypothetical protein
VVELGLTVSVVPVIPLGAHVYVPPDGDPEAVSVVFTPGQIVELLTVTSGVGLTVTVPVPVEVQPLTV